MKKLIFVALVGLLTAGAFSSCKKDNDTTFYTVEFNSQGGSVVSDQKVEKGRHVARPTDPTRTGFDFVEWTRNASGTEKWNFAGDAVRSNMTLFAQWEEQQDDVRVRLQTAVTMSAAYDGDEAEYTPLSWDLFQTAISEAEAALADTTSTDGELQTALDNLLEARDNLVPADGLSLKDQLDIAINAAAALPSYGYTYDSYQYLAQMLNEARAVAANENASNDQIQTAIDNLSSAVEALVDDNTQGNTGGEGGDDNATDKGALNARITYAGSLNESDWTPATWDTLETALTNARNVAAQSTATQAQIDAALLRLNDAIAQLDHTDGTNPTPDPGTTDKSLLQTAITNGQALNQNDYTPESWTNFDAALQTAISVNADANATQEAIDAAHAGLHNSTNALVLKTDSGTVRTLVDNLINTVAKLPSANQITPLNALVLTPVAILADDIRDQLIPLLGNTGEVANELTKLDDVLRALGLSALI